MISVTQPTPARIGLGFVKFLITVVFLAAVAVIGWCVYANWDRDLDGDGQPDGFTLRLLDPDWYLVGRSRAEPFAQYSWDKMAGMKEEIWGDDGWVDQAEDFIERRRRAREQNSAEGAGSDQEPAPTNKARSGDRRIAERDVADTDEGGVNAADSEAHPSQDGSGAGESTEAGASAEGAESDTPVAQASQSAVSPATRRLEGKIKNAEKHFAEGLELYRAADPSRNGWTDASRKRMMDAREHFVQVRELLSDQDTLSLYETAPDHDPMLLADAQELLSMNQRFLYNATKTSGGL